MTQTATSPDWAIKVKIRLTDMERPRAWLARKIKMDAGQFWRLMEGRPTVEGRYYSLSAQNRKDIALALDVPEALIFGTSEPTI